MTITHDFDWRQSGTLLRAPQARDVLPCGCRPADTARRCLTARKLRVFVRAAASECGLGSVPYDNALGELARHLTGEG